MQRSAHRGKRTENGNKWFQFYFIGRCWEYYYSKCVVFFKAQSTNQQDIFWQWELIRMVTSLKCFKAAFKQSFRETLITGVWGLKRFFTVNIIAFTRLLFNDWLMYLDVLAPRWRALSLCAPIRTCTFSLLSKHGLLSAITADAEVGGGGTVQNNQLFERCSEPFCVVCIYLSACPTWGNPSKGRRGDVTHPQTRRNVSSLHYTTSRASFCVQLFLSKVKFLSLVWVFFHAD